VKPPIFADLDFRAALARAQEATKLLLVDATADWCGPCKVMDRTTWADAVLVDALRDRAIAIQIDVDKDASIAAELRIKSMPTVIAFRDGVEVDRVVGLKKTPELLSWLDALERGETSLQKLRRDVDAQPDDMHLRMSLAKRLYDDGKNDEATDEYVWLWKNMLERQPSMYGVRHSFLVAELTSLVASHAPARQAFGEIRDAVAPSTDDADPEKLADWITLNKALDDRAATLAWFDVHGEAASTQARVRRMIELDVVPILVGKGRWKDVAKLYPDPVGELRRSAEKSKQMWEDRNGLPEEMLPQLERFGRQQIRDKAVLLLRALRAAGRSEEVTLLAEEARTIDTTDDMAQALVGVIGAHAPAASPASAEEPPPHRSVVESLLERGWVDVYLDPRRVGVIVPAKFNVDVRLILRIGRALTIPIPDLTIDDERVSGTLSFDRRPHFCSVPWTAVFAVRAEDESTVVWDALRPAELRGA
jgi:thiol-disulfide isomerase/thioredoxin